MARIQTVDYLAMPKRAEEIESCGMQLNRELSAAYASVSEMHEDWYGIRYNELVKEFNGMIVNLNEMLKLVITDIPRTLKEVANNYSRVDRGQNATDADVRNPNLITAIAISNDVGMRFMTANVISKQQQISRNFNSSVEHMNQIETIYRAVVWDSEASEAFRRKFETLKASIVSAFERTNTEFKTLMEQAQQDIERAEKANTVN